MHITINNYISYKIDKLLTLDSFTKLLSKINNNIENIYFMKCKINYNIIEYLSKLDKIPFIVLDKCTIIDPLSNFFISFENIQKYITIKKIMLIMINDIDDL